MKTSEIKYKRENEEWEPDIILTAGFKVGATQDGEPRLLTRFTFSGVHGKEKTMAIMQKSNIESKEELMQVCAMAVVGSVLQSIENKIAKIAFADVLKSFAEDLTKEAENILNDKTTH